MNAEFDDRHYDVWREEICERLLSVDTPRPVGSPFGVRLEVTPLEGPLVIDAHSRCRGLAFVFSRERLARGNYIDAVGLTLVLSGVAHVERAGREVDLRLGDVSLLTSQEPFRKLCSADYREHFIYLPRAFVDAALGTPLAGGGPIVAPHEGTGQILADTLASLAHHRATMKPDDWRPVLGGLIGVVAAVFGRSAEPPRAHVRALTRARVERYIQAHLDDPDLTPSAIAARIGCSARYLHLVFEETGASVGATILAERLERCRARLADARYDGHSISEIAFAAGFNDAAHFSRAFKARFGASARDLRRARSAIDAAHPA